jgi:Fe-S-cluster containining protein
MQSTFYGALSRASSALRHDADSARAARSACDEEVASSPDKDRWQCGNGCDHCCRHPVGITRAEAETILRAIEAMPATVREGLFARIAEAATEAAGRPWLGLSGMACPLLDDGSCRVYSVRPLPCRSLGSTDRDACRRDAEGERVPVPFDTHAHVAGLAVGRALDEATGSLGHRELRGALAAMLRAAPEERAVAFASARRAGDD